MLYYCVLIRIYILYFFYIVRSAAPPRIVTADGDQRCTRTSYYIGVRIDFIIIIRLAFSQSSPLSSATSFYTTLYLCYCRVIVCILLYSTLRFFA